MKISNQTSNVLNSTQWQQLRDTRDTASSVLAYIMQTYDNPARVTQATVDIYNSLHNLKRANVTIAQLCEWLEHNKGYRVKNKKDYEYLVNTIARIA